MNAWIQTTLAATILTACGSSSMTASVNEPQPVVTPSGNAEGVRPKSTAPSSDGVDEAERGDLRTLDALEDSARSYRAFLARARGQARFAEAIERAEERLADIRATADFIRRGLAERRSLGKGSLSN